MLKTTRTSALLVLAPLLFVLPSHAEGLRLPSIIADHMVLQRGEPVRLWGWAASGDVVRVEFAGQQRSTRTGEAWPSSPAAP